MPKQPRTVDVSREPGQYSINLDNYFYRILPPWGQPDWFRAEMWRKVVRNQPIAMICRETLIANILALDWKIVPRDSSQLDESKDEIKYYTRLLEHGTNGLDFSSHVEWIAQDLLDLPFGGASEIGREGDRPEGRVLWIIPLDGSTLWPTLNFDFPVAQRIPQSSSDTVYFPKHAICRIYLSPRPEIYREGWGMAPPEKIYLSLELLSRGDIYYANLLLDTPAAGILDLGDMAKETAESWVQSFRDLMGGINPFKIPVLYEHNTKASWIPFVREPEDIMYDRVTLKYASIVASGYGMSLSDIGMSVSSNGGETLAGTIRQERRTRRTGLAILKKKLKSYFDRILPPDLELQWIDYDDEVNVALGRARLASATAADLWIKNKVFNPEEIRSQTIADGLITVSVPERRPESSEIPETVSEGGVRPNLVGNLVPPSSGGHGDITVRSLTDKQMQVRQGMERKIKESLDKIIQRAEDYRLERLIRTAAKALYPQLLTVSKNLSDDEAREWNDWYDRVLLNQSEVDVPEIVKKAQEDIYDALDRDFEADPWWKSDVAEGVALHTIYTMAYEYAIEKAARRMLRQLYVHGLINSPDTVRTFSVSDNAWVQDFIGSLIRQMSENVDNGTKYYIKRIVVSKVKEALTRPSVLSLLRDGIDIDKILEDNVLVRTIVLNIRKEMQDLFDDRKSVITDFELESLENMATVEQFRKAGLTMKAWETYGPNPCEICIKNREEGFVPLDFEYDGTFGKILEPLAHTRCHCGLVYDTDELLSVYKSGRFDIWYGD